MANSLWLVFVAQILSVVGDAFGQRCNRVHHRGARDRFMVSLAVVSSMQVVVILGLFQISMPASLVSAVFVNGVNQCSSPPASLSSDMSEIDHCPRQGPGSMLNSIVFHPALLLNGVLGVCYYLAESVMYKEPLGLVLLVIASLASSFLIKPMCELFQVKGGSDIPASVMALGIVGSLMCIIEVHQWNYASSKMSKPEETALISSPMTLLLLPPPPQEPAAAERRPSGMVLAGKWLSLMRRFLAVFVPFLVLATSYALWFVLQKFFNDGFHVNVFGYTSLDQGLLPIYIIPTVLLLDRLLPLPPLRVDPSASSPEPSLVDKALQEWNLPEMFVYRLLINARAILYFYLAVLYDLNMVYLELTLVRVLLSWIGSLSLVLVVPQFIATRPEERRAVLHPWNLALKVLGTLCILASLFLLFHKS